MKRVLFMSVLAAALSAGALGGAAWAHAQAGTRANAQTDAAAGTTASNFVQMAQQFNPTATANNTPSRVPIPPLSESAYGGIMTPIMSLFAWLVGVAALLLDNAVYYTVIHMGAFTGLETGQSGLAAIGVAWRVLRDIGNIVLIFGFLAIGIGVIVDSDFYGGGTKMLPKLLIAAVLLNFSLFVSGAVISVGNLFATQFYTQINGGVPPTPQLSFDAVHQEGISNKIMAQLGLQSMYGDAIANPKVLNASNSWFIGFMGILLFIVTAFVFFSLALILVARFVVLVFLIIIAPVGFAGLAIPQLEKTAKEWWGQLINQTITAPVLFLMLYVALAVITDSQFLGDFGANGANGLASWTGFIDNGNLPGFAGLVLSFLIAMGLLLAVVVLAKKMSAFGANWATSMGGKASFGATAWGGRLTFGSLGNALTSKRMMALANRSYAVRPFVAAGRGLRALKYDARNLPGGKALGAGEGSKLTARDVGEAHYGVKPVQKWFDEGAKEYKAADEERLKAGRDAQVKSALQSGDRTAIARALSKMSTKDLEQLDGIKKGEDDVVQSLTPQQFESLLKSDKLTDSEKEKIKASRFKKLGAAIASRSASNVKDVLNDLSKGELEAMPAEMLAEKDVLEQLSDKQRDTLADSKERTAEEKNKVRESSAIGQVKKLFEEAGGGAAGAAAVIDPTSPFHRLTAPQIAKLDKKILLQPDVVAHLAPKALQKLADDDKFTPGEMRNIGAMIRNNPAAEGHAHISNPVTGALWS